MQLYQTCFFENGFGRVASFQFGCGKVAMDMIMMGCANADHLSCMMNLAQNSEITRQCDIAMPI
jgi:hypothetical protein